MADAYNKTELAILNAAEEIFLKKGYDGAKTTEIAQTAGVTHALLHYYFRTKENLFNKVYEKKVDLISHSLFSCFFDFSLPLHERLKKAIESHFDFLYDNPGLPRFVINEIIPDGNRMEKFKNTVGTVPEVLLDTLQKELDSAASAGEICRIKAADLMLDIVSLNVFLFLMYPVIKELSGRIYGSEKAMLEARKAENVKVIIARLKNTDSK
ncbi:MAG: TetR/AcrR family transcriptional regulator [Bacteroidales bacterium]|jgi:AcrR family transcriptional regulator|nr:TetR/AcrR family transcriptional regulator [Bacteroidales bacterium]MCI1784563.1 TetR/AcrR family transcriptional regulator [Bacteroidales bacterium]